MSKEAEYQKFSLIDILESTRPGMIQRVQSYAERLTHRQFYTQVEDIIKVGITRYQEKYLPRRSADNPFVLYEKYSRRDVSLLMNCGKDLSSIMYGMKRIKTMFLFSLPIIKKRARMRKIMWMENRITQMHLRII